jgi:YHS domain-containing protein
MRKMDLILAGLVSALLLAGVAQGEEKAKDSKPAKDKEAALCPVAGKPVDQASYTYFKNRRVYFCCDKCKAEFESAPAKYSAGVKKQWEAMPILQRQVNSPISNLPIKLAYFVEEPDMRVYFASEEEKAQWLKKSPADRRQRKSQMFTFQTTCVISGNDINPEVYRDLNGTRVYFFCDKCAAKGEAAPEETAKKAKALAEKNSNAYTMHQLDRLKALMEQQKREQAEGKQKTKTE